MSAVARLLDATLAHLRDLVAFDTRNPPRAIDTHGIFDYLRDWLPGFRITVSDHGSGAVSLLAIRGAPRLLFNVHLDTVPDSPQWTRNPLELRVTGDRAVGLGACDIKGAAAALLAVAQASGGDLALLFSSDEEGAAPHCIHMFLQGSRNYEAVIVAEPTGCTAVTAHRGIQSLRVRFQGRAGHASLAQQPSDSALHQAVRWSCAALNYASSQSTQEFAGLSGLRFNIGRIEGGIKANMIAPAAELRFGMRPLPSMDMNAVREDLRVLADPLPAEFTETFRGAPLPADATTSPVREAAARVLADALGIPVGRAVDFWTEAALFSAAGHSALVFGPGDIAQAHSADEWVALEQLQTYAGTVFRIVDGGHA